MMVVVVVILSTLTVNEQVDVLPHASVAVHLIVFNPEYKDVLASVVLPNCVLAFGLVTHHDLLAVPPHPSVGVGISYWPPTTLYEHDPASVGLDVTSPGQEIVGPVRSYIHVAVLEHVDVLPHPSLAVKVLVCDREHVLL